MIKNFDKIADKMNMMDEGLARIEWRQDPDAQILPSVAIEFQDESEDDEGDADD